MKPYRTVYDHPTAGLHEDTYAGDISVACYLVPCEEIDARPPATELTARLRTLHTEHSHHKWILIKRVCDDAADLIDRQAAEIERLKNACSRQQFDIQGTLAKALGYGGVDDGKLPEWGEHIAETLAEEIAKRLTAAESDLAAARRMNEVGVREYQAEKERFRERLDAARREVDAARNVFIRLAYQRPFTETFPSVNRDVQAWLARQPAPPIEDDDVLSPEGAAAFHEALSNGTAVPKIEPRLLQPEPPEPQVSPEFLAAADIEAATPITIGAGNLPEPQIEATGEWAVRYPDGTVQWGHRFPHIAIGRCVCYEGKCWEALQDHLGFRLIWDETPQARSGGRVGEEDRA